MMCCPYTAGGPLLKGKLAAAGIGHGGLLQALQCGIIFIKVYHGDPAAVKAALGPNCQTATFRPLSCCTDVSGTV